LASSQELNAPVWFVLDSGLFEKAQYRAKNLVWCYDKWLCADPTTNKHGYLTNEVSTHYGDRIGWEFGTLIIYNEGRGAIVHELELVSLTGRASFGVESYIWTQYSIDGETWSMEKTIKAGKQGDRAKRLTWMQQGILKQWRVQRFRGTSDAYISIARLEARLEPLMY